MLNIAFIMEQHLGHRAYYLNLKAHLEKDPRVSTRWIEVTYRNSRSLTEHLPFIPNSLRSTWIGRQQVLKGLRGSRFDALFFNTQVPAAFINDEVTQYPYVISTDITPLQYDRMAELYEHHADSPGLIREVKYKINCSTFRQAARVLPWSTWTAESVINEYSVMPEAVEVVAPGVDLDAWKPVNRSRDHSPIRILFVGGDLERKGGLDVLEVFKALPRNAAELILVTRANVPETPGVRVIQNLFPNSPELIALYQDSDIFVLPSKAEAFGIAVVEASAAGLPVVTSSGGGLKDIVVDHQTGFTVQPGNRDELKSALNILLENENLRLSFGQAARSRAEQYFDAKKNAHRIMEVVLDACGH